MKLKKFLSIGICLMMSVSAFSGCGGSENASSDGVISGEIQTGDASTEQNLEPITFTMFVRDPGQAPSKDNPILKKITEMTGVTIEFEYAVGDLDQKIGVMIAAEDYPDMVYGEANKFMDADAFITLDELLPQYAPNLVKHYEPYTAIQELAGKGELKVLEIYGTYPNGVIDTWHSGPAFWIQKDVLADAGYVMPKTVDEYFELIENYLAKYPTINEQPTIGFEVLSEGWRAFCLKNAPQHLIGAPNDGDVVVDQETYTAEIYTDKDYSKDYYKKLNEEYKKGVISADTFTQSYDQYMAKISTGRVLGMFDQHWNFSEAENVLKNDKRYERTYVPVPITYEGNTDYYREVPVFTGVNGIGITKNCKDPERLLQFMNFLVEEDTQKLLKWGIEGQDYTLDEDGVLHPDATYIENLKNSDWAKDNTGKVLYEYFPKIQGYFSDGNTVEPGNMPEEYFKTLSEYDQNFLSQYGFNSIVDFLSDPPQNPTYYPVWSFDLGEGSEASVVTQKIGDLQLKYLPRAIIAESDSEFDATWSEFTSEIANAHPEIFEEKVNELIKEKIAYQEQ